MTKNIDKVNFYKIKNICVFRDIIKKVKRQPTETENIFANHVSGKGSSIQTIKELLQLNKETTQFKNG